MTDKAYLIESGNKLGFKISDHQADQLIQYMTRLLKANHTVNVTRITDEKEFIEKHLLDSLTALSFIDGKAQRILDVGTGGGFPGVPLAVMLPEAQITMMDATGKKLALIKKICSDIGITNVAFLHGRAEDFGRQEDYREQYDCVVSRAVANLCTLSELCLPLVRKKGRFLALKGRNYQDEMADGEKAVSALGGKINQIASCLLLQSDLVHVIIVVDKIKNTPVNFPRSFSKIKKDGFPGTAKGKRK